MDGARRFSWFGVDFDAIFKTYRTDRGKVSQTKAPAVANGIGISLQIHVSTVKEEHDSQKTGDCPSKFHLIIE